MAAALAPAALKKERRDSFSICIPFIVGIGKEATIGRGRAHR
jgi:hypothetical protein